MIICICLLKVIVTKLGGGLDVKQAGEQDFHKKELHKLGIMGIINIMGRLGKMGS
jgi:hypothetical protein